MLNKITIKGFKSIRELEDFTVFPVNVLIGANGSGKTNFFDALQFMSVICADSLGGSFKAHVGAVGGIKRLLHYGGGITDRIAVSAGFGDDKRYGVEVAVDACGTLRRVREYGALDEAADLLGKLRVYDFHDVTRAGAMMRASNLHDNRGLRPDGSNLASMLYLLRVKHRAEFQFIVDTTRQAAPFFEDFVLEPEELNENKIRLGWKHMGIDERLDVSSLSGGLLRFIALATLLLQPKALRPAVILLESPEIGLHPFAIGLLAAMVKSVSVDTQVTLATQSSYLVSHFEPEDVVAVDRLNGVSEFKRQDSASLASWLEDYSLGDLWTMGDLGGSVCPSWIEKRR